MKEIILCLYFFAFSIFNNCKSKSKLNFLDNKRTYSIILKIEYNFIPFAFENSSFIYFNVEELSIWSFIISPIIIKTIFKKYNLYLSEINPFLLL